MPHAPSSSAGPVRSELADDPDFREILSEFATALPERSAGLLAAHRNGHPDELRIQAHQLKGAGGGYGFPELSKLAAALEGACKAHDPAQIAETLESLIGYMSRVTA